MWIRRMDSIFKIDCLYVGWKEWAPGWETKAEGRQGETGAADESLEYSAGLPVASSSSTCRPRASCWPQIDAIYRIPRRCHVAVYVSSSRRYLTGSCTPPSSCLVGPALIGVFFFCCFLLCCFFSLACRFSTKLENWNCSSLYWLCLIVHML